jgi:acyl-coenzyme A synthetase/AMP-(fatty) acid ligase
VVSDGTLTADEVIAYVAQRVSVHKKVRRVEFIDAIPKSPSGKILRRVLIERER